MESIKPLSEESIKNVMDETERHNKNKSRLRIYFGEKFSDTIVYVDNRAIGLIQELKIYVEAGKSERTIEIVFPYLTKEEFPYFYQDLMDYIELFKTLPHVKISLCPIKQFIHEVKNNQKEVESVTFSSSEEAFQQSLNMVTTAETPSIIRLKRSRNKELDE